MTERSSGVLSGDARCSLERISEEGSAPCSRRVRTRSASPCLHAAKSRSESQPRQYCMTITAVEEAVAAAATATATASRRAPVSHGARMEQHLCREGVICAPPTQSKMLLLIRNARVSLLRRLFKTSREGARSPRAPGWNKAGAQGSRRRSRTPPGLRLPPPCPPTPVTTVYVNPRAPVPTAAEDRGRDFRKESKIVAWIIHVRA